MRQDLTDITVIIDRSGSMQLCKAEAEGGLNAFVDEQKKRPGAAIFSLVQFDTEYEFVHKGVPVADVPKFTLEPRGWTALLDAVGRAISETGERLKATPEAERPGLVAFVIVTDGQENSSKEFTKSRVRELIQHQREKYGWQFTFLGANQDAFAEAASIGIPKSATANYAEEKTAGAFMAASSNVSRMRAAARDGGTVECSYSPEERASMGDDKAT